MPTMRLRRPAPNWAPRLDRADWPRRPTASPDCHDATVFISAAVERGQGGIKAATARHVIAGLGFGRRRSQKVTNGVADRPPTSTPTAICSCMTPNRPGCAATPSGSRSPHARCRHVQRSGSAIVPDCPAGGRGDRGHSAGWAYQCARGERRGDPAPAGRQQRRFSSSAPTAARRRRMVTRRWRQHRGTCSAAGWFIASR